MIESITITNHMDESLTLELRNPASSGLLIQEINGLGPSKANINTTDFANSDGALCNSSRVASRNITMKLILLYSPTIEDARLKTYKYFPVNKRIKIQIKTDNREVYTYGYVETNEPDIFSSRETVDISIICPEAHLYSVDETKTVFSGILSTFEFPFANDSLSESLLELGVVNVNTQKNIVYDGDIDVGIGIYLKANGIISDLTIYNNLTSESLVIDSAKLAVLTGSGLVAGDEVNISTIRGSKSIYLTRDSVTTNILACLDKDVDWFELTRGDNVFVFYAVTGLDLLQIELTNKTLYEGV